MDGELTSTSIVKLNVGGVRYATSVATLCAAQGSYFDVLFSGRWQQASLTDEGEVFLDRDGEVGLHARGLRRAVIGCRARLTRAAHSHRRGSPRRGVLVWPPRGGGFRRFKWLKSQRAVRAAEPGHSQRRARPHRSMRLCGRARPSERAERKRGGAAKKGAIECTRASVCCARAGR